MNSFLCPNLVRSQIVSVQYANPCSTTKLPDYPLHIGYRTVQFTVIPVVFLAYCTCKSVNAPSVFVYHEFAFEFVQRFHFLLHKRDAFSCPNTNWQGSLITLSTRRSACSWVERKQNHSLTISKSFRVLLHICFLLRSANCQLIPSVFHSDGLTMSSVR